MAFTSDEIQASVEQLVRSTIRRPYDTLGVRRSDVAFSDIQEAAAGVFLLYPRAPFYCVFLGVLHALESVASESNSLLLELEAAISACGRRVLPIDDLTPLFNARAALRELASAATTRTSSFRDITKIPAYQRYSDNTDRFLETSGQSVKEKGDIVDTPQGAKIRIPSLVAQLQSAHTDLIVSVRQLAAAIENFNGVNLSSLVAQSVISNATAVVGNHADELAVLTPEARLESIRQVTLDVIAARSVVRQYGSFGGVTNIYNLTGTGSAYSDATHPAVPAELQAVYPGSYNISPNRNGLDLYLDGVFPARTLTAVINITPLGTNQATFDVGVAVPGDVTLNDVVFVESGPNLHTRWVIQSIGTTTFVAQGTVTAQVDGARAIEVLPPPSASIALPFSFAAQIQGIQSEVPYSTGNGWLIGNGTNPIRPTGYGIPNNHRTSISINGTVYNIPLTLSADGGVSTEATPRTAQQICNDINAVINAHGYTASPYLAPRRFYGKVDVTLIAGAQATFALQGGFGNFGTLGVLIGDLINVLSGAQPGLWTVNAVGPTSLTATRQLGGTALTQTGILVEVGPVLRRIQLTAIDPENAVQNLDTLGIDSDSDVSTQGSNTIGLPVGAISRSRRSTAKELASAISSSSSLVTGSAAFSPLLTIGARSNVTNATLISAYLFRGTADVVFTAGAPNTLTVTVSGAQSSGVNAGDILVTRSGTYPNSEWDVTSVSDTQIVAERTGMLGVTEPSVIVEVGPDLGLAPFDMIRITSSPNQGDYYIATTPQPTKLDWYVTSSLPMTISGSGNVPAAFNIEVGSEYLAISSKDITTASRVKIRGSAASLFLPTILELYVDGIVGSSLYFQLPQAARGAEVGDLLQLFSSDYNTPAVTYVVEGLEERILTLDRPIPNEPSWGFGSDLTVPFARLHAGHLVDFTSFQTGLQTWLAQVPQQPTYFTELFRRINPLLSNASPTMVEINDALAQLHLLHAQLTAAAFEAYGGPIVPLETAMRAYVVDPAAPVDALIRSFKEKGADRAIDLLLGGLFQDFFALSPQTASYAGDFQQKMRAVAISDLPVGKINRSDSHTGKLLGSSETPDTEYNLGDTEGQGVKPDPV